MIKHLILKRGLQLTSKRLRAHLNSLGPNAPGEDIKASFTLSDLKILILVLPLLLKRHADLENYIFRKHFI